MRGEGPGYTSPSLGVLKAGLDGDSGSPVPWEVSLFGAGGERDGPAGPFRPKRLRESVQRPQRCRWTRDGGRAAPWDTECGGAGAD